MGAKARPESPNDEQSERRPDPAAGVRSRENEVLLSARPDDDHPFEPETEPRPKPITPARPTVITVTVVWPRIQRSHVFRRRSDGVRRHIVVEVPCACLHSLNDVSQLGFRIGLHVLQSTAGQCVGVPVTVLLELVEAERRLGIRCQHGTRAGGIIRYEGFTAAAALELVLLVARDALVVAG